MGKRRRGGGGCRTELATFTAEIFYYFYCFQQPTESRWNSLQLQTTGMNDRIGRKVFSSPMYLDPQPFLYNLSFFLPVALRLDSGWRSPIMRLRDHTHWKHISRTPLDELSASRGDLYLTTHDTHNSQISTPMAEFEGAIPTNEWPHIHALDRANNGVIPNVYRKHKFGISPQ